MRTLRLSGLTLFAVVPLLVVHCGGGEAESTQTTAPTTSASTTAAPTASTTAAAAPTIQCPAATAATAPTPATPKAGCPDMSSFESLAKVDLAKELKIDKKLAAQLKDVALATVAINHTSARIESAMKDACGKILADLGCSADVGDLQATCHAASNVIDQMRVMAGKSATITPHVTAPVCKVPAQPVLDCLHTCDPAFKGKADALKCDGTADATGCEGNWTVAKVPQGCAIACAAEARGQAQCTPEQITVQIDGATDADAAAKLKAALEKDLHGVMLQDAARGPLDKQAKATADLLKALPKDMDSLEKKNPRLECFDSVASNSVMAMTQLAVETTLSLNVLLGATAPQK